MVAPFMLGEDHPLNNVNGVFNAIFVHGNMLGDAMFYGSGAGKLPTASAVVADVIEAAKYPRQSMMTVWSEEKMVLEDKSERENRFFVRVKGTEALKEELEQTFGEITVIKPEGVEGEFGFVTSVMKEGDFERGAEKYPQIRKMLRVKE